MKTNHEELIDKINRIVEKPIQDPKNIKEALTHRSYLNESGNKELKSNERLEFLGDAVIQYWVSQFIFRHFVSIPEGKLTSIRTYFVRTETLAKLAKQINLGDFLYLSKGEELDEGRGSQLLLANAFEALVGAIYIDSGIEIVGIFLKSFYQTLLDSVNDTDNLKDSKSLFQEIIQASKKGAPKYVVLNEVGPDHKKEFEIGVYVENILIASGKGKSKQEAEESAAKVALEKISKNH